MSKTFYSNGKLLITGEYVVLDGAKALALPTKFGQSLSVEKSENNAIIWKSYDADGSIWFDSQISFEEIKTKKILEENNPVKNTLIEILHEAFNLNNAFILNSKGYNVTTKLTFPKFWGLGTSSTLLNNIAQWLEIDAYKLLKNSFGGSGYDIACAQNNGAILYQLVNGEPVVEPIIFHPTFSKKLYFVYLNKKQSSKTAIANYRANRKTDSKLIEKINNLTVTILSSITEKEFATTLQIHELELSSILQQETIQEALFSDFDGIIKSLGAWGGDFVLAVSNDNPTSYFKSKGFPTIIPYGDMIL